jgi:DNA sulfur modification protein DndE
MNFRLKTSKRSAEQLKRLQTSTNLTPNVLARLAVGLSLKSAPLNIEELPDTNGIEFNRHTLTGDYDFAFKAMIAQNLGKEITDDDFFPKLFNLHMERGIQLLSNEYKYAGNGEKFIMNLINKV